VFFHILFADGTVLDAHLFCFVFDKNSGLSIYVCDSIISTANCLCCCIVFTFTVAVLAYLKLSIGVMIN